MREKLGVGSWQLAEGAGDCDSSTSLPTAHRPLPTSSRGFTLLELVITLMVLTIMTMGVIPLVKLSVKRQKEQALRETLHEIREAIDQFHREALAGARGPNGQPTAAGAPNPPPVPGQPPQAFTIDPRVRVAITDNTIFGTDNPDRYPPDLETLVNGVSVTPLAGSAPGGAGGQGIAGLDNDRTATSNTLTSTKKKVYLREIPIDPMTGKADWDLRSCYDSKDSSSWGGENVFDVRSKSTETALNGEKYSDW
ncbi:MAG: type II secretion system GspH family protein [Acidobacteriota bacterium]|nr:type II secretion system GspH family protein [Acidobacteriota bacterium]